MKRESGIVIIITYKLVKGVTWLVLATTIVVMMRMGLADHLMGFAGHLRHHAHPWSLALANLVVKASSRRSLWKIAFALVADGTLTLVEGWSLLHGRWWGPWLVVAATGSLLPIEVLSLFRHPHTVRAVVLVVNIVIVAYLARKATREHEIRRLERRERRSSTPPREALPPA